MNYISMKRREFLKLLLAAAGWLVGTQIFSKDRYAWARDVRPLGKHSWAMVIDQDKCIGCGYCELARQASNDVAPDMSWIKNYEVSENGKESRNITVSCMHCENAPCVSVCPVGASYYRDDGIVMMDYDRCIGCRYCQVACPYGAREFNWYSFDGDNPAVPTWGEPDVERRERGVVEKCSFCYQRIDRGLAAGKIPGIDKSATPACVNACPTGARLFGDLNDPESLVSKALANAPSYRLREELGTNPRVYYLNAQRNAQEIEA